ncbi:MAG: outer membrane protein assembly factor BamD [Rhodoferax sp.]|nr:outer membrane protein assembly factor BamD [Rhodoferax sp.]
MLRVKLSIVHTVVLLAVACGFAACETTPPDTTAGLSPNAIYADAKDAVDANQFDKAITLYEKLEARAAGTPLAQQAQLDKAFAQYRNNEPAQAVATLDRFIKLHPASPALDYAIYLKGIIYFNDNLGLFSALTRQDLSERDQKASKEAFASFKELVVRFPESRYAPDAAQRMNYIVASLAQYEVHVASYYYKRGAYLAAANRAQMALADYRNVPALEEALFILFKSYEALGMQQLSTDARRVLERSYPDSEFLTKGAKTKDDPWWKLW